MLSEEALERLSERLVNRIEELNLFMIKKLGEQIVNIGELTPSQLRQVFQSVQYGSNFNDIVNMIAQITDKNVEDIYNIFEDVAKKNQSYAKQFYDYKKIPFIPFEENDTLKSQVKAIAESTVNQYLNMSNTMAYVFVNDYGIKEFSSLSETYQKVTDRAVLSISQGRESFDTVMKKTMKELTSQGLRTVDYASGYSRRMDSSVRMNIMDGVRRLNRELQMQFGEEFGADGVEVSHHKNSAPDHIDTVDGKQFSKEEYEQVNNGLERHVGELNCYHFIYPIILGVSKPLYSKEQLEADKKANKEGFEFEGTKYTNYQGTQLQRQLETKIRQYKDRQIGAKAIQDKDEVYKCQDKIDQLTQKYKELSDVSGLPTKVDRLRVEGFTRVAVNKNVYNVDTNIKYKHDRNEIIKKAKEITTTKFQERTKNTPIERINKNYSRYDLSKKTVYLGVNADEYSLIHELGHKLSFNFTKEEKIEYNNILKKKFSLYSKSDFKKVTTDTGKYWLLKNSDGFVTKYQSRIYHSWDSFVKGKPNPKYALEYISVGVEYYFKSPRLLKSTDKDLYDFLDRMLKDD